ncbi:hypothetical protein FA13DRAFT_1748408 [Coprinellus micaceus]|uniref:F-box domain-containing protein n=1 Tax=Coprinellus micaceus TaxID=71717 RepID=A0A4Y7RW57_COPMI|nr:hypothetical protein FA13DRAFT_1748408 [Coprinellus micaceus]
MPAAPRMPDTPLAIPLPKSVPLTPQQVAIITNKIQTLTTEVSDLEWQLLKLSPVRHLPLEFLGEVFARAFPEGICKDAESQNTLIELGLVSKRWKDASLLKQQLWSDIRVVRDDLWCWGRAGGGPKKLKVLYMWDKDIEATPAERWDGKCSGEARCQFHNQTFLKFVSEGPALDSLGLLRIHTGCFKHLVEYLDTADNPNNLTWWHIRALDLQFRVASVWPPEHNDNAANSVFASPIASFSLTLPWRPDSIIPDDRPFAFNTSLAVLRTLTSLRLKSCWDLNEILPVVECCASLVELEFDAINSPLEYSQTCQYIVGSWITIFVYPICDPCDFWTHTRI